jgi:hypothetical protein
MKIENSNKVPQKLLAQADDIWQMDDETLYTFVDNLWTFVPEEFDQLEEFFGPNIQVAIRKRQNEINYEKERARNATVVVDGEEYKTLSFFDMYHLGWEMDTKAWVVEKNGKAALVHSSHGNTYFVDDPMVVLQAKIKELNNNIKAMKSAVTLLEING